MNMIKYPLLISCHRSGSTWVQSYIRQAYLTNCKKTLSFSNTSNDDEFLDPDHFDSDINYKINFLKSLRERKIELCHKILSHMLYDKNTLNWFIDFYKDHDIIILKRRNLWKALLSYLFHNIIKEKLKDINDINDINKRPRSDGKAQTNIDILKSTIQSHNIEFKFNKDMCIRYFKHIRYLNTIIEHKIKHLKPQLIYMEEINNEFLQKRFAVPEYVTPMRPLNLKYHIYFKSDELEKLKQFFQIQYENEFKFYDYKYEY